MTQADRRSFLKTGVLAVGAATVGAGTLMGTRSLLGEEPDHGRLTEGDAAILRFLAAVEIIESDLWLQYAELGGVQDAELLAFSGAKKLTGGSALYTAKLNLIDADMSQYIHDNTEDEFSHFRFLNAYLQSKGADAVSLDEFRTLDSSKATGAQQIGRITNLMQLTVDTSWYTRYRSRDHNPDLDPAFAFPHAVPSLAAGQHPAIPRTDDDLTPDKHIQAIANTAAFHFAFIEQGGTSLYPQLVQRVTSKQVQRILLSIGPTETMHFQTWQDKAGNAVSDPLAPLTDPKNPKLQFPNLNKTPGGEDFQTNLIMPEPAPFLSRKFPRVSIIRPTETKGAAMGAVNALTADGLFVNQRKEFFAFMRQLAHEADEAHTEDR